MPRKTYVWDRETGELVPKSNYSPPVPDAPVVHGNIEPFVSSINKEVISDRGQLRRHNKEHGVTDSRDYSPEFMKKREHARHDEMTGNNRKARQERIELLNYNLQKHGV